MVSLIPCHSESPKCWPMRPNSHYRDSCVLLKSRSNILHHVSTGVSTLAVMFQGWYDHKRMHLNSGNEYFPHLWADHQHTHSMNQASVFLTDHKSRIKGVNWLHHKHLSKTKSKNTKLKKTTNMVHWRMNETYKENIWRTDSSTNPRMQKF
jgi:hypothetical protein